MRNTQLATEPPVASVTAAAGPAGTPGRPIIDIRALSKAYGDNLVLRGVDLTVRHGEIMALLGPNGAGKTTLVGILSTLVRPDSGTAVVAGAEVTASPHGVRGAISLTGQNAAVDGVLTGRENLRMMARLRGLGRGEAVRRSDELLRRFDLIDAADRRVDGYSGGMRRRLDIALSLIRLPRVLFLDEPTTGLDPRSRSALWDFVREIAREGVTVLLTTQYLEEADQLADRIAVLSEGRIAALGTAPELKRRIGAAHLEVTYAQGEDVHVAVDGTLEDLRRAIDELRGDPRAVESIELRTPTLDDVFLTLTDSRRAAAAPASPRGAS